MSMLKLKMARRRAKVLIMLIFFQSMEQGQNANVLWDQSPDNRPIVVSPASIAGDYPARQNSFLQVIDCQLRLNHCNQFSVAFR
jgi:hypothetical protein